MQNKHKKPLKIDLKSIMDRKGITYQELSEKTGLHYVTCLAIGNGKYKRIGIDTLTILCDALDIEIGELLVRE